MADDRDPIDLHLDMVAAAMAEQARHLDALVAEVDRLRRIVAAADHMAAENESAARRVTGEAGEARGGVQPQSATPDAEVRRLRAIEQAAHQFIERGDGESVQRLHDALTERGG